MSALAKQRTLRGRPDPIDTAEQRERIRQLAHEISQLMVGLDEEKLRWVLISPPTERASIQFIYEV